MHPFVEVEWSVLYTAQLFQKAKKFHDGVIRLVQAGPNVKQVSNQRSVLNGHANLRLVFYDSFNRGDAVGLYQIKCCDDCTRCYSCINCIFRFFYWMKKVEC